MSLKKPTTKREQLAEDVTVLRWDLNHLTADQIYTYLKRMFPDDDFEYIEHMGIIINHTQGRADIAPTIEEMRAFLQYEKGRDDTTQLDRVLIRIWEEDHPET